MEEAVREAQMDPTFLLWKYSYLQDVFVYQPQSNWDELYGSSYYIIIPLSSGEMWSVMPAPEHDPANNKHCTSLHGDGHPRYKRQCFWWKRTSYVFKTENISMPQAMKTRFREFKERITIQIPLPVTDLSRLVSDYFMF